MTKTFFKDYQSNQSKKFNSRFKICRILAAYLGSKFAIVSGCFSEVVRTCQVNTGYMDIIYGTIRIYRTYMIWRVDTNGKYLS